MANSKFEYVKRFEHHEPLLSECYLLVRLDGRSFHKFTAKYDFCKPNDPLALHVMNLAGESVLKAFPDVILAYGDSDEYSFLLRRNSELFNRRGDKIATVFTSTFTASYSFYWNKFTQEDADLTLVLPNNDTGNYRKRLPPLEPGSLPTFDGRVVVYPHDSNVRDYFSWRQVDCHINNLYNTSFWTLVLKGGLTPRDAEQKLMGTLSKDKHDILFLEHGINYNNEPTMFKRGTTLVRKKSKVLRLHVDMVKDQFWTEHALLK